MWPQDPFSSCNIWDFVLAPSFLFYLQCPLSHCILPFSLKAQANTLFCLFSPSKQCSLFFLPFALSTELPIYSVAHCNLPSTSSTFPKMPPERTPKMELPNLVASQSSFFLTSSFLRLFSQLPPSSDFLSSSDWFFSQSPSCFPLLIRATNI